MNRSGSMVVQRRPPSILFEGLMGKQGGNRGGLKNWKTRLFRVLGGNLEYYDPRNLRNPLGSVSLWNAVLFDLRFTNDDEQAEVLTHSTPLFNAATPSKDRDNASSSTTKNSKKDHKVNEDQSTHIHSMNPNTSTHCADCGQELSSSILSFFSAKDRDGRKLTNKNAKTQCAICGHYFCGFCIRDSPVAHIGHVQYCNVCASEQNFFQSMNSVKKKMLDLYEQSLDPAVIGSSTNTSADPNGDYLSQKEWLKNELKKQVFESLKHEDKDHKILEVSEYPSQQPQTHNPAISHDSLQLPAATVRVSQHDRKGVSPQRPDSNSSLSSSNSSSHLITPPPHPPRPSNFSHTARSSSPKPHIPQTPPVPSVNTPTNRADSISNSAQTKKDKKKEPRVMFDTNNDEVSAGTPPPAEFYMNPLFTISIPNSKKNHPSLSSDLFTDPNESTFDDPNDDDDEPTLSLQNAFKPLQTVNTTTSPSPTPPQSKNPPKSPVPPHPHTTPPRPNDNFLTSHHPNSPQQTSNAYQSGPPPFSLSNHKKSGQPNPNVLPTPAPPPRPSRPSLASPQGHSVPLQQPPSHNPPSHPQLTYSQPSSPANSTALVQAPQQVSASHKQNRDHKHTYRSSISSTTQAFSNAMNYDSVRLKPRHAQQLPTYTVGPAAKGQGSQYAAARAIQEPINLSFTIPSIFRRNCFCIKTPDRELWVNCETHHEKLKWLSVLRTVAQEVTKYSTQPFRPLPDGIEPGSILSSYGTVNQGETDVKGVLSSTILEEIENSRETQDDADGDDVANRIVANRQQRLLKEAEERERQQRIQKGIVNNYIDDPNIPPPPPDDISSDQPSPYNPSQQRVGMRRASVVVTTANGTNELLVDITNDSSPIQVLTPRIVATDNPNGHVSNSDLNTRGEHAQDGPTQSQLSQLQKLDEQLIQQIRLQLSQEFESTESSEKLLLKQQLDTKQNQLTKQQNEIQLLREKVSELDPIQSLILHTPAPTTHDSLKTHVQYHLIHEAQKLKQSHSMSIERDYSAAFPVHLRNLFPKILPSSCINLRKRVGGGAYGDVYKGLFYGTEVAIKTLKQASIAAPSADPNDKTANINLEALQDLCREIAILSTVNHPNVVLYCGVTLSDQMIPYELLKEKEDAYVVLKSQIATIQQDADKLMLEREHHNRQYQSLQQTMGMTQRSSKASTAPHATNTGASGAQTMLHDISRQIQSINTTIQQKQIDIQQLTQDFLLNTASREKQRHAEGPGLCLVTEWCERGSLFDMLYNYSIIMDTRQMFEIALDIARGMNYLHNCTPVIVHRDLKSQNILIGLDGKAKIADFGLSLTHNKQKYNSSDEESKPKYGVFGTPEWMAPEVMLGKAYNEKVDVYSFGILLTELFARQMPYTDLLKDTEYHTVAEYVIVCEQMPTVPSWCNLFLFPLIKQCVHPNPNMRPTFDYICSYFDELLHNSDKDLLLLYDLKRIFYMLNDKRIEFQALGAREITNLVQTNRLFIKLDVCSRSFQVNPNQNLADILRQQVEEEQEKLDPNSKTFGESKTAPPHGAKALPVRDSQMILRAQDREFEEYNDYIDDMAYMMTTTSISNLNLHSQLQQNKNRSASVSGTPQPQQAPISSMNENKQAQEKLRAQLITFFKPFSAQVQKYKHLQKQQQAGGTAGGSGGNPHGGLPAKKHTQFGLTPANVLLYNTHVKCCCILHSHGGLPSSQYLISPNQLPLPDYNTLKGYVRAHHYNGRPVAQSVSVLNHPPGNQQQANSNSGGQQTAPSQVEPQLGLPHPMVITDIEKDVGTDGAFIWNDLRAYFVFKQTSHPLYSSTNGSNSRFTTTNEQYNSFDASEFVHRYLKNQHSQGSISHTYSNSLYSYACRYNNPLNRNLYTTPTQIPDNDAINIILRIIYLLTNAMVPETQHEHELCYLSWVLSLFEALLGLLNICDDGEAKDFFSINYNPGHFENAGNGVANPNAAPVHGLYMETCYQVCHSCQEHNCNNSCLPLPPTPSGSGHRPSQFSPTAAGSSSSRGNDKSISSIVNRNHSNSFAARSGSVSQEQTPTRLAAGVTRDRLASNFQGINGGFPLESPDPTVEPKALAYISTRRFICDLIVDEGAFFSSLTFFGFQLRDQNIIEERIQTILEQRTKVLALQQHELQSAQLQLLQLVQSPGQSQQHQQILEHDMFIKQQHYIQELYDLNLEFDVLFNAIQLYKSTQDVAEHVLSYLITILPISLLPTLCYGVPQHIMSKLHSKIKRDLYEMYSLVSKVQFAFQRFGYQEQIYQYFLDSEYAKHNNSRDNPYNDMTIGQLQPKYQLVSLFGPRQNIQDIIRDIYLNQQLNPHVSRPAVQYQQPIPTSPSSQQNPNYPASFSNPSLRPPSIPESRPVPLLQTQSQVYQQHQHQQQQQQQPSPSYSRTTLPPPQRNAPTANSSPVPAAAPSPRVSTMQQILQSQSIKQSQGNSIRAPVRPAPTLPKSSNQHDSHQLRDYNHQQQQGNIQPGQYNTGSIRGNQHNPTFQHTQTRGSQDAQQSVPSGTVKSLMSAFQQPQ